MIRLFALFALCIAGTLGGSLGGFAFFAGVMHPDGIAGGLLVAFGLCLGAIGVRGFVAALELRETGEC